LTAAGEGAGLTRENLAGRTLVTLRRGSWSSPDVLLVESDRGHAVVKDFAPRSWLVRATLGRWLIRHELEIYRALDGHPAVPRAFGRLDALAFVVEHRSGSRFSRRRPRTFSTRFVEELRQAVRALHARGVVHLDLRHRSNIRAAPDGRPVLIDFDSALRFRKGSLAERLLLPLFRRIDERGLAKWDERVRSRPGEPS
jgi:serine/threonine protein kinase